MFILFTRDSRRDATQPCLCLKNNLSNFKNCPKEYSLNKSKNKQKAINLKVLLLTNTKKYHHIFLGIQWFKKTQLRKLNIL